MTDFVCREIQAQDAWASHFTPAQGPRIVVTGGSSCTFSIAAGMATEEFHVPVINGGLEMGEGSTGICLEASRLVKSGDTLVLALELPLYSSSTDYTHDLLRTVAAQMNKDLVSSAFQVTGQSIPWDSLIFAPRPGLESFSAFVGRSVSGVPFRYASAEIKPGGLMVTKVRMRFDHNVLDPSLNDENRKMLIHFRDWCDQRNVHVVCSIPWNYTDPAHVVQQRLLNARFISILSQIFPVLHEEELGAKADPSLFADMAVHLAEPAAESRTRELIGRVLAQDYWTEKTLAQATSQKP